ncbi:LysR substrate-binding domain-containing protein [Streptomyces sp. NPDC002324]
MRRIASTVRRGEARARPVGRGPAAPRARGEEGQRVRVGGACHQAGFTPSTPYVTADIAAQFTLALVGLATALVPRTAIDPTALGIRTAPIEEHPIRRLLFAATRHTDTPDPRPPPSSPRCARPRGRVAPRAPTPTPTPTRTRTRTRPPRRAAGGSGVRTA